jgi:hypothetical protein
MAHISDIKLIRTDTTLDLSQKAEKGMSCNEHARLLLYTASCLASGSAGGVVLNVSTASVHSAHPGCLCLAQFGLVQVQRPVWPIRVSSHERTGKLVLSLWSLNS